MNWTAPDGTIIVTNTGSPSAVAAPKEGLRYDTGKPRMELICPLAMAGLAAVLAQGAEKYGDFNWTHGMKWSRCLGSLLRHTFKFMSGEDYDSESKLPHVDHMMANAMFLANYFRRHKAYDDRQATTNEVDTQSE